MSLTVMFGELLLTGAPEAPQVLEKQFAVQRAVFASSVYVRSANFDSIRDRDLRLLFDLYDRMFFDGRVSQAINGAPLAFRFAPRMTSTGGRTTCLIDQRTGERSYEIAISSHVLFESFRDGDHRTITVCGVVCETRIEALQRVFEHELTHLIEYAVWRGSNCAAARFQQIASRWFLHRSHLHAMITRRERAAVSGIRPGARVSFVFEGRELMGVVNRVTSRVTVLVEDANGMRYSDGKRYAKYYIPLGKLHRADDPV